ncbi:MAG: hypothetical protein EOM67_03895 [Spirochaetia bacterium]|nr:hypothetical protein [Spirochaetia bacterium]
MDEIKKGDYVVFKLGKSMISEDKRLETRFLVSLVNESIVAINILGIGLVAVEKDRLELAPNRLTGMCRVPEAPKGDK